MASGSFTGTTSNTYITPRILWSSTANTSTNKSSLTVRFQLCKSTLSNASTSGTGSWKLTIGSSTYSFSDVITIPANGSYMTVYSKTVTISHDDDGGKSVAIKVTGGIPSTTYTSTDLSKTIELDTIPRSSSFSIPSSINTGSSLTVTINPSSSSFRHKVRFYLDDSHNYTSGFIAAGQTSFSYTIPHSWLPKATSKKMTVYLYTYASSGDDYIARISKTITVNVPSNIKPSVSKVTATISGGLDGIYVQGKSKVKLVATATPGNGASITSYIFKGANINGSSTSYTSSSNTKTSSTIQSSGKITYTVAAKDTRGRISDEYPVSINVYAYANPQIKSISAQRCLENGTLDNNGTYAKVTVKISYTPLDGANKRVVKLYNDTDNYVTGTEVIGSDSTSVKYTGVYGDGFSTSQTYTIKAVITDSYNTGTNIYKTADLDTAIRTINIAKYGNGVAVGGMSTVAKPDDVGLFECSWPAEMRDKLTVSQNLYLGSHLGNNKPYNSNNFAMFCQWKDGENHDMLVRSSDGLTMGLGWVGSSTYPTTLDVRPKTAKFRGDVYIGDNILNAFLNGSNEPVIQSTTTYNRTYDSSPNLYISSNGVFGRSTSSSQRYKTDISDVIEDELNPYNILDIPIRQYKYDKEHIPVNKNEEDLYIGLIAEEVAKAYPAAAEYNEDGQVEMWNIKVIVPAMLKILQDQQKIIDDLKQKVEELEMNTQL